MFFGLTVVCIVAFHNGPPALTNFCFVFILALVCHINIPFYQTYADPIISD